MSRLQIPRSHPPCTCKSSMQSAPIHTLSLTETIPSCPNYLAISFILQNNVARFVISWCNVAFKCWQWKLHSVFWNTCVTEFEGHNTGQNNIEQCSYNSLLYDAQMSLRCQKVQIMHSLMQCPLKPNADEKKFDTKLLLNP